MLPSSQIRDVTIKDYIVVFKRRIWIILSCFIFITLWSVVKTLKKISLYQATAKIYIERFAPQIAPVQQVYAPPSWVDKDYIQTQVSIITSRTLAKKAVDSLIASGDTTFAGTEEPEKRFLAGASSNIAPGSSIVNVSYINADPIKAAKFANALANAYIQQDVDKGVKASQFATGWLESQLTELKKKLESSETALTDFTKKNEIVSIMDPEKRPQAVLEGLKAERLRIETEIAGLSKRYKAKHPRMISLNTRLISVTKNIEDETMKLLVLNDLASQYNSLKREVETNKSLFETFLRRAKETEVSKELQTTNIRLIDLADVPRAPFTPNRKRDISMGVMFGILLGGGLAFFVEYLDSSVKTAEDVEMYVRLPFLGYVPSAKRESKVIKEIKDIDTVSYKHPESRIAEAYRSIRTSIIFSTPEDKPLRTILITSTAPQEGKTTVTINLATIFARANEKTLIVEADMRKPRISGSLDLDNKMGLSSFLAGTSSLDASIKQTFIPNLFILPSGPKPPNPTELLTSAKTRSLLEELKTKFDRVIVDSPPILTVADAAILANTVDGVIEVIRSSFQNIEFILRSRQRLVEVKARIIGVILNNVDVKREDSYYYYHYYYAEKKEARA